MRRSIVADLAIFALAILVGPSAIANLAQAQTAARAVATNDLQRSFEMGEVWAGALHGGRMVRFNPKEDRWIEYVLPEPYSHDRRTWIDNSTTPVTVWYVDHNGYMVRVQPRQ